MLSQGDRESRCLEILQAYMKALSDLSLRGELPQYSFDQIREQIMSVMLTSDMALVEKNGGKWNVSGAIMMVGEFLDERLNDTLIASMLRIEGDETMQSNNRVLAQGKLVVFVTKEDGTTTTFCAYMVEITDGCYIIHCDRHEYDTTHYKDPDHSVFGTRTDVRRTNFGETFTFPMNTSVRIAKRMNDD